LAPFAHIDVSGSGKKRVYRRSTAVKLTGQAPADSFRYSLQNTILVTGSKPGPYTEKTDPGTRRYLDDPTGFRFYQ
jgi:hypothetical protein